MNVLQVVPELNAGGVERTTIEIATALGASGHVAHVVSAGGRMEDELVKAGGVLHRLKIGSKNPLSLRGNTKALIKIIRDHKIDIIHARSRAPAWPASAAARATHTPFITTYHGIYNARSRLKRRYNAVMAKGDIIIANSNFTKKHIIKTHGVEEERIRVIARGVNMNVFNPAQIKSGDQKKQRRDWGVSEHAKLVLLPGRLTRWKGQSIAIEAIKLLHEHGLAAHLVLLGDAQGRDDYVMELQEKSDALNVSTHVHIMPHSDDMPLALSAADLVISASTEPEAFGRVMIEAQAMEKLVVATDHGGALETVKDGDAGLLVSPSHPQKLAMAMLEIFELSPKTYKTKAGKSRDRIAKTFSDKRMQDATLAVYQEILTQNDGK